jgi:hypothetical protein
MRGAWRLLPLVTFLLVDIPSAAMAQRSDDPFPFTAAEYYRALRLFMPDSQASLMARGMAGELDDAPKPSNEYRASGGFITDDLLIVMSLLSDELREKVDRYRRAYDPRYHRPEDQRGWDARREEIRKLMESGEIKPPD